MNKVQNIVTIMNTPRRMALSVQPVATGDLVTYESFQGWVTPFIVDKIVAPDEVSQSLPEGVYIKDENAFKWIWDYESCRNVLVVEDEEAIFIEHYAQVTDEDSRMEEPVAILFKSDTGDIEDKVEKSALKNSVLNMSGNHCEAEYMGLTGKTLLCKVIFDERVNKLRWDRVRELTPATVSFDELYKID